MARTALFPEIEPFEAGMMDTGGVHQVYWEQSGNPTGVPVIFLHGGPGGGAGPTHRRFYDPDHYRIVVFDQRGCGRSTPTADLTDNTTPHLIADIEQLREQLGIERWIVFGGSWGSALALAYGEAHPVRCLGLVVRGILVAAPEYLRWGFHESRAVRPQAWEMLVADVPQAERDDLDNALERRMFDPDPAVHGLVIRAWMAQAGVLSNTRHPSPEFEDDSETPLEFDRVGARLSMAYLGNHMFLEPDSLLNNAHRLHPIPGIIIQGLDDYNTTPEQAWRLQQACPQADYREIPDAGHSSMDRNNRLALVEAMEDFKTLV